jgi:hypothetical protein
MEIYKLFELIFDSSNNKNEFKKTYVSPKKFEINEEIKNIAFTAETYYEVTDKCIDGTSEQKCADQIKTKEINDKNPTPSENEYTVFIFINILNKIESIIITTKKIEYIKNAINFISEGGIVYFISGGKIIIQNGRVKTITKFDNLLMLNGDVKGILELAEYIQACKPETGSDDKSETGSDDKSETGSDDKSETGIIDFAINFVREKNEIVAPTVEPTESTGIAPSVAPRQEETNKAVAVATITKEAVENVKNEAPTVAPTESIGIAPSVAPTQEETNKAVAVATRAKEAVENVKNEAPTVAPTPTAATKAATKAVADAAAEISSPSSPPTSSPAAGILPPQPPSKEAEEEATVKNEEAAKLEAAKLEAAKLEAEKIADREKIEAAKLEAAKLEAAKLEAEKIEAEKIADREKITEEEEATVKNEEAAKLEAEKIEIEVAAKEVAAKEAAVDKEVADKEVADKEVADKEREAAEKKAAAVADKEEETKKAVAVATTEKEAAVGKVQNKNNMIKNIIKTALDAISKIKKPKTKEPWRPV